MSSELSQPAPPAPLRRILLVGPLPERLDVIGGTKVVFSGYVHSLAAAGYSVRTISTTRPLKQAGPLKRAWLNVSTLVRVLFRLVVESRRVDMVMFGVSSYAALSSGPPIWAVSRMMRKPLVVRIFGGDFCEVLATAPRWRRRLAEATILQTEQVLVETQRLVNGLPRPEVRYFPNVRDTRRGRRPPSRACRRFIFLSQLRPEKGVREAIDAAAQLPEGCTLTFVGPIMPGMQATELQGRKNIEYLGTLPPEEVPGVLAQHDAFVFPTYYPGEGIPGALVEALQCGLPVIASRWGDVPELIENDKSGLLVSPRSTNELRDAMRLLADDDVLFQRLAAGALARGDQFRTGVWQKRLEELLQEAHGARVPARKAA